jgi:hypothetical protein
LAQQAVHHSLFGRVLAKASGSVVVVVSILTIKTVSGFIFFKTE